MSFLVPKPINGWRAFWGEVGIIVIGVLIALGAQQVAEGWQWRQRTGEARVALAREITNISALHYERLIVQRCLLNRLAFLADRLEKSGPEWKGEPEYFINPRRFMSNALPIAYRPPQRAPHGKTCSIASLAIAVCAWRHFHSAPGSTSG